MGCLLRDAEAVGDLGPRQPSDMCTASGRVLEPLRLTTNLRCGRQGPAPRAETDPEWITAMDRDSCHHTWFELLLHHLMGLTPAPKLLTFDELLDGSNGGTDGATAQAPRPEWTGAVLAKCWKQRQGMGDGACHRSDLTASF
jgi:hypothetical protein